MTELINRVGLPMFIQISIESWNELYFLMLIVTMLISVRRDRSNELMRKTEIPMTIELIIFFIAVLVYNLADILVRVFSQTPSRAAFYITRIGVFVYCMIGEFQTLFFLWVVNKYIVQKVGDPKLKIAMRVMAFLQISNGLILLTMPISGFMYFFDEANRSYRNTGYYIWQGVTIATFAFIAVTLIAKWKLIDPFIKKIIVFGVFFPIIALFAGVYITSISMNNIMVAVTAHFMFVTYENNKTRVTIKNAYELEKAKTELAESRLALEQSKSEALMAQIHPHFITNSLMAIRAQCTPYPEVYETITNFSRYLRSNFEALGDTQLITFEQEMETIEAYLSLERRNYGERLNIEYDIDCDDFLIPALSVQPLVENAVRHGIGTFDEGGTVTITAHKDGDLAVIDVIDDGSGHSSITDIQKGRKGVGIENVRKRLTMMSGGKLDIIPSDSGTTARITVPYSTNENE